MEDYVKEAVDNIFNSKKKTIEIKLKSKEDYKKSFCRLNYNKFIMLIQRKIVPCHIKNFILRTTGMKVGHDACIPHDITFDPYFPELIELKEGCLIGGETNIITHKLKGKMLTLGKVSIGKRTLIGGMSNILPGSSTDDESLLMWYSDLSGHVSKGELWSGKPAKKLIEFSKDDMKKYFGKSNGKHKRYYKEFRKKVDNWLKDPNFMYFKINYNGKRLNAGDDWWRARNFFRIWYNGAIMELCRLLSHSFIKTILLKMMGVNIGKNVYIGKGVVFDHIYGDKVIVEDNVKIEDYTYLDCHEYTISQTIFGRISIKKGVHLKHHSYVRPGTIIGENTTIEPRSFAQKNVPPNVVVKGLSGKIIKKKKV